MTQPAQTPTPPAVPTPGPVIVDIPEGGSQSVLFDYATDPNAPDQVTISVAAKATDAYFVTVQDLNTHTTYYSTSYGGFIVFYDLPAKGHKLSVNFYKPKNPAVCSVMES